MEGRAQPASGFVRSAGVGSYEPQLDLCLDVATRLLTDRDIRTVVELGARDCRETREFARRLPDARIFAFECNPQTLPECREAVSELPNAELVEKAVADRPGPISFFPIDPDRTETTWKDGNPGASSLLQASGKYPVETYAQREITVEATTLEAFMEERRLAAIDLLWMDIQGAERMALEGLGARIGDVNVIHTEAEFLEIYAGQPLFAELKSYLNAAGFRLIAFTSMSEFSADAVFVNTAILDRSARIRARATDSTLTFRKRLHFHPLGAIDPRTLVHRIKQRRKSTGESS
jgi:FkbM family methyltransferase